MNPPTNRHIYRRWGNGLEYITTALAASPAQAIERADVREGKYVVTDLNFTEIDAVTVTRPIRVVMD